MKQLHDITRRTRMMDTKQPLATFFAVSAQGVYQKCWTPSFSKPGKKKPKHKHRPIQPIEARIESPGHPDALFSA